MNSKSFEDHSEFWTTQSTKNVHFVTSFLKSLLPKTVKSAITSTILLSLVTWILVTFYHGWNHGLFHYNDAEVAINKDCKSVLSSIMRETCTVAEINKGVHPLIYATEYTLITMRDSVVNVFLTIIGSSLVMVSIMGFVAFCFALWYIKPSTREPVYVGGFPNITPQDYCDPCHIRFHQSPSSPPAAVFNHGRHYSHPQLCSDVASNTLFHKPKHIGEQPMMNIDSDNNNNFANILPNNNNSISGGRFDQALEKTAKVD